LYALNAFPTLTRFSYYSLSLHLPKVKNDGRVVSA
jgi:hypothetical protein